MLNADKINSGLTKIAQMQKIEPFASEVNTND